MQPPEGCALPPHVNPATVKSVARLNLFVIAHTDADGQLVRSVVLAVSPTSDNQADLLAAAAYLAHLVASRSQDGFERALDAVRREAMDYRRVAPG